MSMRGFAALNAEQRRAVASLGGKSVKPENRAFSRNRDAASEAGRKGGASVPSAKRAFSRDPALASQAGQKGGLHKRLNRKEATSNE